MAARKKDEAPQNFEDAMQRLDAIVAKLEEDKLPLDEMLARYEEGVALARWKRRNKRCASLPKRRTAP